MKKEVLIAVVSGIIIGLIVTLGIYTANKALEQQKAKKAATEQGVDLNDGSTALTQKSLTVTSHQPYDLVNEPEIILSGIAWPKAAVALMTESDNFLIEADEEGIFSFTFKLVTGFNELILVAADDTGATHTLPYVITYSEDEFLPPSPTPSPSPEAN